MPCLTRGMNQFLGRDMKKLGSKFFFSVALLLSLGACDIIYHSSSVNPVLGSDNKVRTVKITAESVLSANRSSYSPKTLPAIFYQTTNTQSSALSVGAVPEPVVDPSYKPAALALRVPPEPAVTPYKIGVGDVLLLATPQVGSTVEQLSGLLAASNSRQGYTVQDDGAIAIPNVGRVSVVSRTLEEAEATLFQALVSNQIDPTFSLEIAEFNSQKVSIGGAVANPTIATIALSPLYLDEALAAAGGVTSPDVDYTSVRIYRDGTLYQIPLKELYSNSSLRRVQLVNDDSIFVDTAFELDRAQAYFAEQIRLAEFRQTARSQALNALDSEVDIRRGQLAEARENYQARVDFDAVDRDYVYLAGEVGKQSRYALPYGRAASLADALYGDGEGIQVETGNAKEIYVLRGAQDPREFGALTAWNLDARNAGNLILATRFELRPNDVIFIAEQPVTRWSRVVSQITPSLLNTTATSLIQ